METQTKWAGKVQLEIMRSLLEHKEAQLECIVLISAFIFSEDKKGLGLEFSWILVLEHQSLGIYAYSTGSLWGYTFFLKPFMETSVSF